MKNTIALLSLVALLSGCQTLPQETISDAAVSVTPAPPEPKKRYRPFTEESLYALLVGEIAGQRNRFDIALAQYSHQAQRTQDPGVAERALRIAEYVGDNQAATENALIWAKAAPHNADAQRAAALQLAKSGYFEQSLAQMEKLLQSQGQAHFDFLALAVADSDPQTRAGVEQSFARLLQKHPNNTQLLFGKALLMHQDNRTEDALALLSKHDFSQEPGPLLLQIKLLQALKRQEQALPLLRKAIDANPNDRRLRLNYARLLIELEQLDEARSEFAGLLQENPSDNDLRFSLALVCLESEAWAEAIVYLNELIERQAHVNPARFNLGRAYEALKQPDEALKQYAHIGPSDEFLPAILRQNDILLEQNRLTEAGRLLANARQQHPDYAIQLYLLEVENLAKKDSQKAWTLIHQALDAYPDDLALLYTRGMLADSRGDTRQLEADMRAIIEREPDNTNALNALGYTLADRTDRYQEAYQLIHKAHTLEPENPAILDSLGWVYFRLGNLSKAQHYLEQAYARYPDAEIGAHLAEVLWAQGMQAPALEMLKKSFKQNPNDAVLRDTLKRLTGQESL